MSRSFDETIAEESFSGIERSARDRSAERSTVH